jgi:hypothetical protein
MEDDMKRIMGILMISGLVFISCTGNRFTVVKPIYPEVTSDNNYPDPIESLQPTFRWDPSPEAETYDFVIYKAFKYKGFQRAVGREIYYREGLKEPEHKIEEPLAPNAEYYWSVRIRRGQFISNWSLYYNDLLLGYGGLGQRPMGNYRPYIFKTPQK